MYKVQNPSAIAQNQMNSAVNAMGAMQKQYKTSQSSPGPTIGGAMTGAMGGAAAGATIGAELGSAGGAPGAAIGAVLGAASYLFS